MLSSAGEFAARWNALRPDVREKLWKALQSAANDGYQCHLKNHDGLEAEHAALFQKHVAAKHEIQGLLDSLDSHVTQDEIYSQLKTIQEAL